MNKKIIHRIEQKPPYKKREFIVTVSEDGGLNIGTYYIGPRGGRSYGGTATITTAELAEIIEALKEVKP